MSFSGLSAMKWTSILKQKFVVDAIKGDERPVHILIHSTNPGFFNTLQSKLSQKGYSSTAFSTNGPLLEQIDQLNQIARNLYPPVFISHREHAHTIQYYLESHRASAVIFLDPVLESESKLTKEIRAMGLSKLESCKDTRIPMIVLATETDEIEIRLETESSNDISDEVIIEFLDRL